MRVSDRESEIVKGRSDRVRPLDAQTLAVPAQQRLETYHLPRGERYLRLVKRQHQIVAKRDAGNIQHGGSPLKIGPHFRFKHGQRPTPAILAHVQRQVRRLQQVGRGVAVHGVDRRAGGGLRIAAVAGVFERLAQQAQRLYYPGHHVLIRFSLQQHGEFVAAQPAEDGVVAKYLSQAAGEGGEQNIARIMADRVVHFLEMIDVQQHQRERSAERRARDGRIHLVGEKRTVGKAGQRIVSRRPADPFLRGALLGHVADGDQHPLQPAGGRVHPPPCRSHPPFHAIVRAVDAQRHFEARTAVPRLDRIDQSLEQVTVLWHDQ